MRACQLLPGVVVAAVVSAVVVVLVPMPPDVTTYSFLGSNTFRDNVWAEIVETAPEELDNPQIRNIADVILELFTEAENFIDMEVYTIYASDSSPLSDIHSALFDAAGRGVHVRIFIDNEIFHDLYESEKTLFDNLLSNENIELKTSPWPMHSKMIVVDNQEALVSSANLSWSAMTSDREIAVYLRGEIIVRALDAIFESGWYDSPSTLYENGWPLEWIKPVVTPVGSPEWAPETLDVITGLIGSASSTIHAPVYAYSGFPPSLRNSLNQAAAHGVELRMIVDHWYTGLNDFPYLYELGSKPSVGIKAATLPYAAYHTKSVVVDGRRGYVGSANWSNASMTWRREIGICFDDENLASAVEEIFQTDWNSSYVSWVARPELPSALPIGISTFVIVFSMLFLHQWLRERKRQKQRRKWIAELWASSRSEL